MAAVKTGNIKRPDNTEETLAGLDGKDVKSVARERAIEKAEADAMSPKRIDPSQVSDLNQFNTSGMYHINAQVHEFMKHFRDPVDHSVSFFYPHYKVKDKLSPTWIDVVRTPAELQKAGLKAAIMKGLGRTYYVYRPDQANPLTSAEPREAEEEDEDE